MKKKKIIIAKSSIPNVVSFIKMVGQHSILAEEEYGIQAEVLIAQSALETGWGKYILKDDKGSSYNLFNIKKGSWTGDVVVKRVHEFDKQGNKYWVKDPFRKYNNFEDSFKDYCKLISTAIRYRKAYESRNDMTAYLTEIHKAGYATDPKYVGKILSIVNKYIGAELVDENIIGKSDNEIIKQIKKDKKHSKSILNRLKFWK